MAPNGFNAVKAEIKRVTDEDNLKSAAKDKNKASLPVPPPQIGRPKRRQGPDGKRVSTSLSVSTHAALERLKERLGIDGLAVTELALAEKANGLQGKKDVKPQRAHKATKAHCHECGQVLKGQSTEGTKPKVFAFTEAGTQNLALIVKKTGLTQTAAIESAISALALMDAVTAQPYTVNEAKGEIKIGKSTLGVKK